MKTIIHVNKHHIAANTKDNGNRPVYTVKQKGKTFYGREIVIHGPSKLVYNGSKLNCGARAWVETESEVEIIDKTTFKEIHNDN